MSSYWTPERYAAYWRAVREINDLWRRTMIGRGSKANWRAYRQARAAIWRRHGLTWQQFNDRRGRVGRRRV